MNQDKFRKTVQKFFWMKMLWHGKTSIAYEWGEFPGVSDNDIDMTELSAY